MLHNLKQPYQKHFWEHKIILMCLMAQSHQLPMQLQGKETFASTCWPSGTTETCALPASTHEGRSSLRRGLEFAKAALLVDPIFPLHSPPHSATTCPCSALPAPTILPTLAGLLCSTEMLIEALASQLALCTLPECILQLP